MTSAAPQQPGDLYYDPYDYGIDADPHPIWRRLRDEAPVYHNDRFDFYALSRFDDVLGASLDAARFSSGRGTVLELMDTPLEPAPMIFKDPPEHDQLRKLVSRAFSPRRIAELEPRVRELAARYLDPHVGGSGFDYVAEFGALLPVMVISSLLGIPEEDQDQIRRWTDLTLHRELGETNVPSEVREAQAQVHGYFARYVADRRAHPRDDMMTDLLQAELTLEDGTKRRLSEIELHAFYGLLSAAGNETVARFLGWAATLLASHPGERAKLVADPSRIPNAVEELLRYEAPSPVQGRTLNEPVELHGTKMPAGSKVLLLTASAGRDERAYPDADRFDVDRRIDRHVSLGYGIHFCLGASLARLEARVALEETLRRFPEWNVDESGLQWVHTSTVRGYANVPIRL